MKTVDIGEVASLLEKYDNRDRPLILTRNGQPVAALFPIEDLDSETLGLSVNPKFIKIIEESRKSQREEGRIFLEEIDISDDPTLIDANLDENWRSLQMMIANYLVKDYRENGIDWINDAKIKVAPIITSENWLLATWLILHDDNPHGVAGQVLFKQEGDRWLLKGEGNCIQDVNILIELGVPRSDAETLVDGLDI
ncbi:MAG: type II toxin-antitoxin system Phd/YefM family antitoxin [Cyanobacteria bacterium SBLK]|nr:type II toxin-antitoxin system Phd/YefM family antitoxin [Cyanobacteria bacterium SBLK]